MLQIAVESVEIMHFVEVFGQRRSIAALGVSAVEEVVPWVGFDQLRRRVAEVQFADAQLAFD